MKTALTALVTLTVTLSILVAKDYIQQTIEYRVCNAHSNGVTILSDFINEDMLLCPLSKPSITDSIDAVVF